MLFIEKIAKDIDRSYIPELKGKNPISPVFEILENDENIINNFKKENSNLFKEVENAAKTEGFIKKFKSFYRSVPRSVKLPIMATLALAPVVARFIQLKKQNRRKK